MSECKSGTFFGSENVGTDHALALRVVAQCDGSLDNDCGFCFLLTDSGGDAHDLGDWWITASEAITWDATHQAWSRMDAQQRADYETSASLTRPRPDDTQEDS